MTKQISERLFGDEMQRIDEIIESDVPDKDERIRAVLLELILRHAQIALEMSTYQPGEKTNQYKQEMKKCVGKLLRKDFDLWHSHGASYRDLLYFFDAPPDVRQAIEHNGDTGLPFVDIIDRYQLGKYSYPAIWIAILAGYAERSET